MKITHNILALAAFIMAVMITTLTYAAAPGSPETSNINLGKNASITVTPDGTAPFTYQWQKAATVGATPVDVAGANAATLTITAIKLTDTGIYSCKITNAFGSCVSPTATLTAGSAPTAGGTSISVSVN